MADPDLDLAPVGRPGTRRVTMPGALLAAAVVVGAPVAYWWAAHGDAGAPQEAAAPEIRFACEQGTYAMVTPDGTAPIRAKTAVEAVRRDWTDGGRLVVVDDPSGYTRVWVLEAGSDTRAVAFFMMQPMGHRAWSTEYCAACPGHQPVP